MPNPPERNFKITFPIDYWTKCRARSCWSLQNLKVAYLRTRLVSVHTSIQRPARFTFFQSGRWGRSHCPGSSGEDSRFASGGKIHSCESQQFNAGVHRCSNNSVGNMTDDLVPALSIIEFYNIPIFRFYRITFPVADFHRQRSSPQHSWTADQLNIKMNPVNVSY